MCVDELSHQKYQPGGPDRHFPASATQFVLGLSASVVVRGNWNRPTLCSQSADLPDPVGA